MRDKPPNLLSGVLLIFPAVSQNICMIAGMKLSASLLLVCLLFSGCQTKTEDIHLKQFWLLGGYEAFSINGIQGIWLGSTGQELIDSIRGTHRGTMALAGHPDLVIEVYELGEEDGDRYGIWFQDSAMAKLPHDWSNERKKVQVYHLDAYGLMVVKSRAKLIEQNRGADEQPPAAHD